MKKNIKYINKSNLSLFLIIILNSYSECMKLATPEFFPSTLMCRLGYWPLPASARGENGPSTLF